MNERKPDKKIGLLLVNLGTPNSYEVSQVRSYLKQFLWDKRVIDIPRVFRFLLLYLIILPFRAPKSAKLYKSIWTHEGSPLAVFTANLSRKISSLLPSHFIVEHAMRYQNPSIPWALKKLSDANIEKLIVLPLFPQYSSAANGSVLEEVYSEVSKKWNIWPVTTLNLFYDNPLFINCFAARIKKTMCEMNADYVLFSYHGLPERHVKKSDLCQEKPMCLKDKSCCDVIKEQNSFCYRAHCFQTTRLLAQSLNLVDGTYQTSFQSRLGRSKWIEPYTDKLLPELAKKGFKRIAVTCPACVADCLETLEEIANEAKNIWLELGGEDLRLVPSLNDDDDWANAIIEMVKTNDFV